MINRKYKRIGRNKFKWESPLYKRKVFWILLLVSAVIGTLIYFVFFSAFFQISAVEISGNQKILNEDIKEVFHFSPSQNIFLVDLKKGKDNLLDNYAFIAEVKTAITLPDKVSIEIRERKPVAIFFTEGNSFYVDIEGIAFQSIIDSDLELIKISNTELSELKLGERVINKDKLTQILEIAPKLSNDFSIPIKEFLIVSRDRLNVVTEDGWEIYLNLEGDIEWQLAKLKAVLNEKIPSERRKNLEYIEIRFGNFAPFKYKN